MLTSLTIKNIALIDDLTIELEKGFNCITGETGAGKSLIIDSISLLLGERADKSLISQGKDYAFVEAVFYSENKSVLDELENLGLERESMIVISRKISFDGRNECRVNGKVFTLSMLKKITPQIMDLHGQFEHQTLLSPNNHIKLIDSYGKDQIKPILDRYKTIFYRLKDLKSEMSSYTINTSERLKMIDLYKFQIDEIETASFKDGEEEKLKEFRVKVLHQEKIIESVKNCLEMSRGGGYGGLSISNMIGKISAEVSSVSSYFEELKSLSDRLDSIKYEMNDIVDTLESLQDNLYFNEYEAQENEKRLDLLSSLKKKYGNDINEINSYLEKIKSEYNKLVMSEETICELLKEKEKLEIELESVANELTLARKNISKEFENTMQIELESLGMKNSKFVVDFKALMIENAGDNGFDRVEFLFSANAGYCEMPLSKIASGGEMSRLMLAIKNIAGSSFGVDTMIFDEIDTGISGKTSTEVAKKMAKISKFHQVLAVTHSFQVVAMADNNIYVSKNMEKNETITSIKNLTEEEIIENLTNMLGVETSSVSKVQATELRKWSQEYKKSA